MQRGFMAIAMLCLAGVPAMAQQPSACLRFNQVERLNAVPGNDTAMIATDIFRRRYRLTLRHACSGFEIDLGGAIRSRTRAPLACVTPGDEIVAHNSALRDDRCPIARIEAYTPEMEAADKAGAH